MGQHAEHTCDGGSSVGMAWTLPRTPALSGMDAQDRREIRGETKIIVRHDVQMMMDALDRIIYALGPPAELGLVGGAGGGRQHHEDTHRRPYTARPLPQQCLAHEGLERLAGTPSLAKIKRKI